MTKKNTDSDNKVLTTYHASLLDKEDKLIIDRNVDRIVKSTRSISNGRAKLGEVSALQILYKLGRFLNEQDDS